MAFVLPSLEELADGINRALSLLQMVQEGNRCVALGGQNPLVTTQLRNRCTDGNAILDEPCLPLSEGRGLSK